MKCTVLKADGAAAEYSNVMGLSVDPPRGDSSGDLVLIESRSYSTGNVVRIKRWDWDSILITKDFMWEQS